MLILLLQVPARAICSVPADSEQSAKWNQPLSYLLPLLLKHYFKNKFTQYFKQTAIFFFPIEQKNH